MHKILLELAFDVTLATITGFSIAVLGWAVTNGTGTIASWAFLVALYSHTFMATRKG